MVWGTMSVTVQMRDKGGITLPADLRKRYRLNPGDVFTLVDLGDGSFLLTARTLQTERLGDLVADGMARAGLAVEDLLAALDEERELYYRDHYAQS
jgi:bifunctional DNA-binding transcriptional regulator/antitoxin component of YhaV-PrlF toxin-antitoxin module